MEEHFAKTPREGSTFTEDSEVLTFYSIELGRMSPQKEDPVVEGMRPAVPSLLAVVFLSIPVSVLHSQYAATLSFQSTPPAPPVRPLNIRQSQGNILRNFTEYRDSPTIDDARPPRNESRLYPVLWITGKMRDTAYDLLVAVGHRMKPEGVISSKRVGDMEGAHRHDQSLSKLLFEFHKDLNPAIVSETISTIHLMVNSSNREIVKSVLEFIKVTTIRLDVEIVLPRLQDIVSGIIRRQTRSCWSTSRSVVSKKANAFEMEMDGKADEEDEETTKKSNRPYATFGSVYEVALYASGSGLCNEDEAEQEETTRIRMKS
ncbi:MAG: hypothetical protein J3Q66DRAFT_400925 [Benniella sp.]|nr:MAG: hypothetical protein J3Q66DRAFT_400925 [Benniella sp.]